MANCGNVIELTFLKLRKINVIRQDKTEILSGQIDKFDALNQFYSDVARNEFGVLNPGLMFSRYDSSSSTTGTINVSSAFGEAKTTKTYARVNKEFTDEFQQKYEFFNSNKQINDANNVVDFNRISPVVNTLSENLTNFLNKLNVSVEFRDDIKHLTGYDALSTTDLLYKTILIANNYKDEGLVKETAYIAYKFLGIKNKIRTDLISSIENIDNYNEIFNKYKKTSPNLNDYKIKELIVVDFIADAIKNNYEVPQYSYQNRKADYWSIKGNTKLIKQIKYLLIKLKKSIQEFFNSVPKLSNVQLNDLLNDIANDILNNNFQKFSSVLQDNQQLTNYKTTIAKDKKANDIVNNFLNLGMILTGSLSLRKQGTLYRTSDEDLHDLDFSITDNVILKSDREFLDSMLYGGMFILTDVNKIISHKIKNGELSFLKKIKELYPNFKVIGAFKGLKKNEYVITASIDNYAIDLFIVNNEILDKTEKGFQDWQNIFVSKLKMGRAKDIRDFANYIPYSAKASMISQTPGFRHFTFNNIVNNLYKEPVKSDIGKPETLLDLINDKPSIDIGLAFKNVALLQNQARANEMVIKMAEKLSTQTGIPYEIIDADLARALLKTTAFPYNNEAGFTFNGKAYFVKGLMTINTVFHEFSHPIVQAIAKGNLKLFNNLFSILENTPEGKEIIEMVKRKYPEHANNPVKFKEECIVKSIEKDAINIRHAEEGVKNQSEGFAKFIKEMMYQIKQFFRKTFGRVRVEKLKSTTTINELANMLINNDFQLNSIEISDKDIVDYARANDAILQELYDKVDTNEDALRVTQLLTNDFLATARKQSGVINTFQNKELAKEIADRSNGGGLMGRINSDLSKYATTNFTEETSYARNQLDVGGQCIAFTNSLATLDAIIDIINKHLSVAKNSTDASHDVINKTQYYNSLLDDWSLFAQRTLKDLNSVGLTRTTALHTLVTRIKEGAEEGKEMFKELQQKTAIDATMSVLKEYNEKLEENYKAEIKRIEDIIARKPTKTALAVLEETKKKWEEDKITEEKIKAMYKGELGDTSWWAGMFLSYTDSSDPIVGGFALYLKNNLSILQNNVIRKIDKFNKIIRPMLKELGITNTNVRKEWAFALYQDKAHKYTKGVLTERAAWAFLSSTKDYAFDVAKVDQDIDDARTELSTIDINDPDKQIEGLKKLKDALKTRETLLNTYFNRENISAVYEAESQLLDTPEGVMAFEAKTVALDALYKASLGDRSELETYEKYDVINAAVKAYSQLFNVKNEDGSPKTNNPGSAKWEDNKLAVAEALQAHRERTRKYYEWLPIKGAFDKSLSNFEDELRISQPNLSEDEITAKVESWINRNTVVGYTDEYYQITNDAWTLLKELKAKLPADIASAEDTSDLFSSLSAIINMNKDELGQPDGTVVKPNVVKTVKDLQEQLNRKYDEYSLAAYGLSLDEYEEFIELRNLDDEGEPLNPMERLQLKQYMETMKEFRSKVPTSLVFAITSTVNKLVSLKGKVPTTHYLDQINELLSNIPGTALLEEETAKEALNLDYISQVTWVTPTDTPEVKLAKEKFSTWYLENHVQKSFFNKSISKKVTKYERLNIWSISKPKDPKYYQTTEITRNGKTTSINRIPSLKFKFRVVKNEFRTIPFGLTAEERNKYVGTVIDNKGNFLPKNIEQGAPVDSPYVNKAYYDLKKNNPKQFELLEAIKEWHLENQIGVARPDKLYMELPRYLQEDLEAYQSGQKYTRAKDNIAAIAAGAKALVSGKGMDAANEASAQEGDFENDLANPNAIDEDLDTVRFVNQSISNPYTDRLPVKGISNLSVDDTSLNVLKALNTYAYHTEKQRLFNQINPVAKAIVETLEDTNNDIKNMQQKQGTHATDRNIWNPSGAKNVRAGIARALYDREFKGDIYSGGHLDFLNKITSGIMHAASFNYFALNLPSAIKNYWGALMQANLEAIAGEHMNLMTLGKGKLWGKQAMIDWAQRIYGADNRSLNNQMIMFFDPAEGKAEESVIKDTSRTYLSDVASMTWLYSPRKFMEMEATLQLFAGMMYFKKIIRTVNGVETLIPYMEAFELDSKGDMVLKEGINEEYNINGTKFLAFKNLVHQKHKELNGTYAKFEKPQAQGHFAYRLIMFMRGYFTSMFMNRFGAEKNNFVTGQKTAGFYIDSLKGMSRVITTMGDYMPLMPARERMAIRKLLTEFGQIAVISLIVSLFFGYDDKDPERFAKLREKSGPIGSDDFQFWGFLSNHSLSLLLKTQNENESLIPLPGYGLNDYVSMANAGSIAFNPTVKQYARIINDAAKMMAPGDDPSTAYQRDMGPYPWQKAESEKIWTHFAGLFGITGKDVEPIGGIKTVEMISRGM